jgi:hypothetical protein
VTTTQPADLPRLGRDSGIDTIAETLRDHGVVVVEQLVDSDLCGRVLDEVEPHLGRVAPGSDEFTGTSTRRVGALLDRSPAARDLVAHPLVVGVADEVLGAHATSVQLHLTQVIAVGPGSAVQPLHRDQWCFDFFPFPPGWHVEVSSIWALTPFTADDGATRIVPGSHLLTDDEARTLGGSDAVPAEMAVGSVVLYLGSTVHGAGANRSDGTRIGCNVDYSAGWLRQEENQYLSTPPSVAADLPEPLQRLAGYSFGAYALGYWGDLQDPAEVLGSMEPRAVTSFDHTALPPESLGGA